MHNFCIQDDDTNSGVLDTQAPVSLYSCWRRFTARSRRARLKPPSILKGGDYVKSIIATPTTFAVTATGIVPELAHRCP